MVDRITLLLFTTSARRNSTILLMKYFNININVDIMTKRVKPTCFIVMQPYLGHYYYAIS